MRIVLLIDLPPDARYHRATVEAIGHGARFVGAALDLDVCATDKVPDLDGVDGIVMGPGTPYRNEHAVWDAVRTARERGVPLVGT